MRTILIVMTLVALPGVTFAQLPAAIAVPGESIVATWHAEGAQVYECKAGADGKLAWAFREPIATLLFDGKTIGRHYAGPNWEHMDGSAVRSEEHTSELQSPCNLVCRLLLEKKKQRPHRQ